MKRGCEARKARSKAGSFEKSGGFGNAPWREGEDQDRDRHREVEELLDEERRGDGRVARARDGRAGEEEPHDVAAAGRHDGVEAVAGEVGAPDALEPEPLVGIGGAQDVERRARPHRQVGEEQRHGEASGPQRTAATLAAKSPTASKKAEKESPIVPRRATPPEARWWVPRPARAGKPPMGCRA